MKRNIFKEFHKIRFLSPGAVLALHMLYCEALFQIWIRTNNTLAGFAALLLFAAGFGGVLGWIAEILPGEKTGKWAAVLLGFLCAAGYLTEFFLKDAYQTFMTPAMILHSARGVITDYTDLLIGLLLKDLWRIVLMLLPVLLACAGQGKRSGRKNRAALLAASLAAFAMGCGVLYAAEGSLTLLKPDHDFEGGIRSIGLPAAVIRNFRSEVQPQELTLEYVPLEEPEEPVPQTPEIQESQPEEPEKTYAPNILPLDYAALAAQGAPAAELHRYIAAQTPSYQNEYTGLFKGKNLILITAEAFTAEVIDPERTPTLYRLANQGIRFTDYYQPAWGASTIGGEMANLFGLVPDCSGGIHQVISQLPSITMGYQLTKQGYWSAAFHNNTGSFYERNRSHINLGYDRFYNPDMPEMGEAITPKWPQSDLEMMEYSVPKFIDQQPFNVYFMTVSGHSVYTRSGHYIAGKNYDVVADLDYPEPIKCYLAANMELEYAMAYLVQALEDAGIADDTVIVLTADHYPYGLDAGSTWGNNANYYMQLFGAKENSAFVRDHSALIIWSGCLEGKNITVDAPTYSLDILPTLSNLFGLEYESRLLVGRDVFSDVPPLVLWPDGSWKTERGSYLAANRALSANSGFAMDEDYVARIHAVVKNKINFSHSVQRQWYLRQLRELTEG